MPTKEIVVPAESSASEAPQFDLGQWLGRHAGTTFTTRTLKTMIETQANWAEDDLRRLKLIR